jgi:hypothetical protein
MNRGGPPVLVGLRPAPMDLRSAPIRRPQALIPKHPNGVSALVGHSSRPQPGYFLAFGKVLRAANLAKEAANY